MSDLSESSVPALCVAGEFTIFTAGELKGRLLEAIALCTSGDIEIDLSDVTEIDSAGLQLMIMAKREAAWQSKTIRFCRHSDPVLDLIDLCDLAGFFGDPVLIRSKLQG
ncbi:STAS domain-containing protein [Quatrionicoccus australiensis]|uniref:STAS domain-containing protein n=1 Tax=Quatrionicoccus australiensis TaxID=138118 RepID=UPI001CFC005C|nr:STAS domain-containing protein [Quatrionicoccus australiensis]MCB4361828.1 STAS domain-containing protein [Quatrionicoccus australiensis]